MVKKIALEEHFLDPATEAYWRPTMVDVAPAKTAQLYASLTDFSGQRLQMMDKTGIARAVLAIAGPGVQAERDAAVAVRAARASNDFLAKEVQKRPDRYSGFAHLAMQDAKAAADELDRCVRDLKFCGAMINGHTNGQYLDDRALDPFWERVAALDTVVYLHPADPVAPLPAIDGYNVLARPMWGWGVETGSHALRIICGGVFHRYPKAKLVLGHLGETLPFLVWRIDTTLKRPGGKAANFRDIFCNNFYVTTSGNFSNPALLCCVMEMGIDRILFAVDWPFVPNPPGTKWMESVPLCDEDKAKILSGNAKRLLKM